MAELINQQDIDNLRGMMPEFLDVRFGITNLRRAFSCPFPDHDDRNPSACYYANTGTIFCHGCHRGGDVFAVKGIADGISSFPDQVRGVAEDVGYRLSDAEGPPPKRRKRKPRPPFDPPREAGGADCSEMCVAAFGNLYHPDNDAGRRFLRKRGLDDDDIAEWGLGYARDPRKVIPSFNITEPEAEGFVIIPFWNEKKSSANYCMARTVSSGKVNNKEWRPAGITSPLWNEWMLTASLDVVLVTEGLLDAMALHKLTRGKDCMALGGIAGAKRLAQVLYHADPATRPGLLVICMDQDDPGKRTRDQMSADLCKIKVPHICVPRYPGGAKDADEWLMAGEGVEWEFVERETVFADMSPQYTTRWLDG